jgi:hypothetical protein
LVGRDCEPDVHAEELVERLAALVPQPGSHLVLYHGVLAGRHAWRSEVVPEPPQTVAQEDESALTRSGVWASSRSEARSGTSVGSAVASSVDRLGRFLSLRRTH